MAPNSTFLKTERFLLQTAFGAVVHVLSASLSLAAPLGTAFTYQGVLKDSGAPQNGTFHFTFTLWDAETLGSQVGLTHVADDLPVTDGLFVVELDFGAVFDGTDLWLEIALDPDGSGGSTLPSALSPRQHLTATPYALHALSGDNLGSHTATQNLDLATSKLVGNGGSVGITIANNGDVTIGNTITIDGLNQTITASGGAISFDDDNLITTGTTTTNALTISGLDCSANANGGTLTADPSGVVSCSDDDAGSVGNTLDGAYDQGGAGAGRIITADAGAVRIEGAAGLEVESGATSVSGSTSSSASYGGSFVNTDSSTPGAGSGLYAAAARYDAPDIVLGGHDGVVEANADSFANLWLEANGSVQIGLDEDANSSEYFGVRTGTNVLAFTVDEHGDTWIRGDLDVNGTLTKGGGSFKIDHPLDPENKYLYHSFVESPEMMNVYNGNVKLDARGDAWVALPDWFEALNRDFRYQLTPIGAPGPNLYIATPVTDNRFQISGGTPETTVSWQVTGVRRDPFANANRIQVEMPKPPELQGTYLHPEAWGQSRASGEQ